MKADLRFGPYKNVLADAECDLLLVDAPYSERTHSSHNRLETADVRPGEPIKNQDRRAQGLAPARRKLNYAAWHRGDVLAFVDFFAPRTRGWFVSITDDVLAPVWREALEAHGRYVFAPLPLVETGSRVRFAGDGPSSWTCWIVVSRPRNITFARWGTLPGAYVASTERHKAVVGGKPLGVMRALVRDYSRVGDTVCDPCAGGGTSLLAALIEGRYAIGSEVDPDQYAIASERLARPYTPTLFADGELEPYEAEQLEIGLVDNG